MAKLLLVGMPRGGTTWAARVLAHGPSTRYLHEPDNPMTHPAALRAALRLGVYPAPVPGTASRDLQDLWGPILDASTAGRRVSGTDAARAAAARRLLKSVGTKRTLRQIRKYEAVDLRLRLSAALTPPSPVVDADALVVKSVHAAFSLEWLWECWQPPTLVMIRDPMSVVASWMSMGWTGPVPPQVALDQAAIDVPSDDAPPAVRITWFVLLLTAALRRSAEAHGWPIVTHEDLCTEPQARFRELFERFDLEWSPDVEAFLLWTQGQGSGYSVKRDRASLNEGWRERLTAQEIADVHATIAAFPAP